MKFAIFPAFVLLLCSFANVHGQIQPAKTFIHPGLLHTQVDLDRIKQRVTAGEEPWKSGFAKLREDQASSADWKLRGPFEKVVCAAGINQGDIPMTQDGNAAYQNALMWIVTGEEVHAQKAIQILDAWAAKLQKIEGPDARLRGGLNGFKLVNAAEIMRSSSSWKSENVVQFKSFLKAVILPQVRNFAPDANGNWDAACIGTLMSIGVFCDEPEVFEQAVEYFRSGQGNGRITHYVVNDAGQCQESGRDQQHTQLGLALLAQACEIAWNQGVDLYGEADNRLLKGFEYTAKYNLGMDVSFVPHVDVTGRYKHKKISDEGRNSLRPIYEMVWNHYEIRKNVPAPFTKQATAKLRPEGSAFKGDHPGFGTLLFTLPDPQTSK